MSPMANDPELRETARAHLRQGRAGALATLSTAERIEGFPFGSVVPYALDDRDQPLLLLASIAQHTRNLQADPRASLMVTQPDVDGDPQSGWRATLIGEAERLVTAADREADVVVSQAELDDIVSRYAAIVPAAASYHETHNFHYWRLRPRRIRYIGGFGKIRWLEP